MVTATWTTQSDSVSRYVYDTTDNRTLIKKVISPAQPGVGDCTAATPAAGCEVLEYFYANDRVDSLKLWSWDPAANAMASVTVMTYTYDTNGRLIEATDPRTGLKTIYGYDNDGRVTSATPAGQLPWRFEYGDVDPYKGELHRVLRSSLVPGTNDQLGPDNITRMVYRVPVTRNEGGPYDLDYNAISSWGQKDLPTDATAVFGPEDDPLAQHATSSTPGANGYPFATVHYLNANAQEVNTATPSAAGVNGGNIDSKQYDRYGNVVWSLEATNRSIVLGHHPSAATILAGLNLTSLSTSARADQLSTQSVFSYDGKDLVQQTGPIADAVLESGAKVQGRPRTIQTYDEGKPDGQEYHLETKEEAGIVVAGLEGLQDKRTTITGYDAVNGSHSGWALRKATKIVADAGGENLTAYTVYDSAGKVLESWGIEQTATNGAKETIYYTAGAQAALSECQNKPQWAGQPCVTRTLGLSLPVRWVKSYSRYGDAAIVRETSGTTWRETTTTFDTAGRVNTVSIDSNDSSDVDVPMTTTLYDATNSQPVSVTAAGVSTLTEYDKLGRVVKYTNADGGVTISKFDRYGRPAETTDPTGVVTYAYDRAIEPRGMVTSITDSTAGTFTARYSPDGQLTTVGFPGGITRTDKLDTNLEPKAREYRLDGLADPIYAESIVENAHGQWAEHVYTGGTKQFAYDRLGRLTKTVHTYDGQCTTRAYEFTGTEGKRTNRTAKKIWLASAGGACTDTAGTPSETLSYTYDAADRITGGYEYDAFGRTKVMPGGLTNTFYANDMVASQTLGGTTQSWTLDPAMRLRATTAGSVTKVNHYDGSTDSPKWIAEGSAWTRFVESPEGDFAVSTTHLGAKTLNATNLHGDVVFTLDLANPQAGPTAAFDYDEFGIPTTGNAGRYGWLGGKQRSAEALGGVVLMGVRLYAPSLGRFLSVDPVDGGSANAYDYCYADPINCTDLDGKWSWKSVVSKVAVVASVAAIIPGPIGTAAALVSAGAYAATGNYKQAAIMAGTAALSFVGAGAVGVVAANSIRGVANVSKLTKFGASYFGSATKAMAKFSQGVKWGAGKLKTASSRVNEWIGKKAFESKWIGGASRLFGNKGAGKGVSPGILNQPGKVGPRLGWSIGPRPGGYGWVFRARFPNLKKWDIKYGPRV
ncbi:RHS repeat domain-containing protein [Catelliglobosispora koreensis]|uniref:RHS repeat domain-containing protein n=1 Tax=Catelliglobosispora koreensis TaxID=129052 RepID=UPI000364B515|nr:RHS repeat-associated core domain-containing protein [Catelliglobosispora koreensis]